MTTRQSQESRDKIERTKRLTDGTERIAARVADQDENTALDEIKLRINKYAHAPVTNAIRFFSIGNDPESCRVVLSCSWTDEVAGEIYGLPEAVEWIVNRLARL